MPVKHTNYRQPPTPGGLEKIEKGELELYSPELYANMNTGILEEYLEEKNRKDCFKMCPWNWGAILFGIAVGTVFAIITEYVGLKVGVAMSGGSYIVYLLGLILKWRPTLNNNASGANYSATSIGTGFIFTFPALYLLTYDPNYAIGFEGGEPVFLIKSIPPLSIVLVSTMITGILGTLYFIIFRRLWLVDDPLPTPGFEASIKLLEIANDIYRGAAEQASRSIKIIGGSTLVTAIFTFFRDYPIFPNYTSIMDHYFGGEYYEYGTIMQPASTATWTYIDYGLIPIQFAIGWFMKFRTAFLVSTGTLLTWFVIVPLAYGFNVPVYDMQSGMFIGLRDWSVPAMYGYLKIAKIIAIGALLGGGVTALLKMYSVFKPAIEDVIKSLRGGQGADYVKGLGWYEWPVKHIPIMMGVAFVAISVVFIAAGFPPLQVILFAALLAGSTFFLGAIAVKVMGETGSEPVSGTSFIVLLLLVAIFLGTGTSAETTAVMAILGTTVFGCAISMSGAIIGDYKVGIYIGNRPYHLMRSTLLGIIPGAIASVLGAAAFSYGMATGQVNLLAPQANSFALFLQTVLGGQATPQIVQYLVAGIVIGIFAEFTTGMGTAFGLGMYFPLSLTLPMLTGGALRDFWEKKYLIPTAKREKWSERKRTFKVLDTFMVATGLVMGEAVMGVIVTFVLLFS